MSGSSMPECGNKTKKKDLKSNGIWRRWEAGNRRNVIISAGAMTRRLQNFWTFGKGTVSVLFFSNIKLNNNTHVYFAFRFTHPA